MVWRWWEMRWNVNFKIELRLKMPLFWILRFLVSCFFYLSPSTTGPFCLSYYPQNSKVTNNFCRTYGSAEVKKKGNSTLLQHNHQYSPLSPLPTPRCVTKVVGIYRELKNLHTSYLGPLMRRAKVRY